MRFRSPRSRPTPEAADHQAAQDPASVPGPADPVEPAATATVSRPSPTGRRPRPRPLPSPRPEVDAGEAPAEPGDLEDDEYWDDEYDDYDDEVEYEDDEYWDDEYEDDYLDDEDYEDDLEDEYDDEYEDDALAGHEDEDGATGAAARRRRLLGRRKKETRRRGRLRRRSRAGADEVAAEADGAEADTVGEPAAKADVTKPVPSARPRPRPRPAPTPRTDDDAAADDATEPVPARRRRQLPRVPVAAMRAGTARAWTGTRSGARRGWTATRTGIAAAVHFARTHWGRAAYIYLAFVAAGLLLTVLLYWNSGFTYDECNYCGMPVLMTVSPWWLLILPFNVSSWPLLLPLFVIVLFAGLNAELFDRWSKRPQPEYPDWD